MRTAFKACGLLLAGSVFLSSLPAIAAAPSGAESSVTFQWHPSASQRLLWTQRFDRAERPLPAVSLKVALPAEAADVSLAVVTEDWRVVPLRSSYAASGPAPAAALGQCGIWHGIRYQEILVAPLQPSPDGATARLLTGLTAKLRYRGPEGASLSSAELPARVLPEGPLFLNPAAAARYAAGKGPSSGAAPAPANESGGPSLRLTVSQDGVYRLDYNFLTSHGFNVSAVNAADLHLSCRGVEIPFYLEGPDTGAFGPTNAVVFYGQRLSIHNRPVFNGGDFTDTNVYWLSSGTLPGTAMAQVPAAPSDGFPTVNSFATTIHTETNNYLYLISHLRPDGDVWFWGPYLGTTAGGSSASKSYTLTLPHAASTSATLTAVMASFNTGSHDLSVALNGAAPTSGANPASWTGNAIATLSWGFSSGLVPGANTLTLTVPGFASQADYQIPDYFDVTYGRTLDADSNALLVTDANANAQYASGGYSSAPYILDLSQSDPATGLYLPKLLTGATFASGTATFEMPADPAVSSRRVALSSAPLLPDSAEMSSGRDLSDPSLGADLLIITHPDFHPTGQDQVWQDYLARREAEMKVEVVDIQDVYDNFSYGIFDPTALKSFLSAVAAHWNPVPRYVLLIGDASYDYKNYKQDPTFKDWVPTMMVEDLGDSTYMGRYATDSWFADVNGDGYPDMAVGRLPARSYSDLAGMLQKIMAYEDQTLTGSWYKTALYVADTWTETWEQEFETFNNELQATYTVPPWSNSHVYFHDPPYNGTDADACAAAIRSAWSNAALLHYDGHSGIQFWGKQYDIFTSFPSRNCGSGTCQDSDVDLLAPITLPSGPAPLPFVLNSSCYNAAFDEVGAPALLEAMVDRPDGGAIAACGFTTIAYPDEEEQYNSAVFDLAFLAPKVRTTGDLVEAGRFALPASDERSVLGSVLLGDPTVRLRLPAPPAPTLSASGLDTAVALSWTVPSPSPAGFRLYKSLDGGQTWGLVTSPSGGATGYTDGSLVNGTTYAYYITSLDSDGFEGAPSNITVATPQAGGTCSITCQAVVPATGSTGVAVPFQGSVSSTTCPDQPAYDWDFGDGSAHGTVQSPTHVYTSGGTYSWLLTVSADGTQCVQSGTIAITGGGCTLACQASVPATASVGLPVAFGLTITSPPCGATPQFDWDFGDGSAHGTVQSPTHAYTSAGTYSWTVSVTLADQHFSAQGAISASLPPSITSVSKASNPFRIVVRGGIFSAGTSVFVNGSPWPGVKLKSAQKLVLKGGTVLKQAFPPDTYVPIRIVNADGGEVTVLFNRSLNQWQQGS